MNELSCNDFKKAIEAEFGKVEWKATDSSGRVIMSRGWEQASRAMPWSGNAQRVAERKL
jgi:hypothetical protein